jgi:hypothetical protein
MEDKEKRKKLLKERKNAIKNIMKNFHDKGPEFAIRSLSKKELNDRVVMSEIVLYIPKSLKRASKKIKNNKKNSNKSRNERR